MAQAAPGKMLDCPPWKAEAHGPGFSVPAGACDAHFHIFWEGERFPYVQGRSYTPPDAPLKAFQRLQRILGTERAVIVHPSVYGTDNRASLEAMELAGPSWRGIVVVPPDIPAPELKAMHDLGVRGVRINLLFAGGTSDEGLEKLARKIEPLGWHVQLLIDVSAFPDVRKRLGALPVPVVFDHMGMMPAAKGMEHPGFQDMLALLGEGKAWVKLSGAYRITAQKNAPYEDVTPIARKIAATNPDQCVWGSDWPHPHCPVPMPDDGDLLDMLAIHVPDEAERNRILVENPARLYGFPR
ncbi:MAG: amidohydrolase family protein [Pseudomonadota bacterium]|nr:amidohydrolase family protein [Pseudomonadota bacterium]